MALPSIAPPALPSALPTSWHATQEPAMRDALESLRAGVHNVVLLARDKNVTGSKEYNVMDAPPRGVLPSGNVYEIAPIFRRRHLLLDVDFITSSSPDLAPDVLLTTLRKNVEAIHGTGPLNVQISEASGNTSKGFKHSFHIVFPGTCVTFKDQNAFFKILEEQIKPLNFPIGVPDFSIYSSNRCMRMLYQNKMGSDRVLVPYAGSSPDVFDHLWCIYQARDDVALTWVDPNPTPLVVQAPRYVYPALLPRDVIDTVEALVDCLNVHRATEYMSWLKVGAALYHIGEGIGDVMAFLPLWDSWSDKANNYVLGACEIKWRTFSRPSNGTTVAMGSLRRWAKDDDPAAYADIVAEEQEIEEASPEVMANFFAAFNVATAPNVVPETVVVPTVSAIPDIVWSWKPSGREPYTLVKEKFELFNFKITQLGMFGRFNRGSRIPTFNTEAQLKTIFKDWHSSEDGDTTFISKWLSDVNKRSFETVDFSPPPHVVPDYVFNTFYGFAASRLECEPSTDMSVIEELVDIMGGRDVATKKYILDWMAACLQVPARKSDATAILFCGEQGIGKNLLIEFFGKSIIGSDYYKKPQNVADQVFGRFADAAENTILLFLDECKWLHKHNDALKDLITSDEINIEHKGQQPRKLRNCMHILMATNNEDVLKVEVSDRRTVIVHSSSEKLGDVAYFDMVAQWMEQASNVRGFYNYLMTRDISNVRFQHQRPKTALYEKCKIDSLPLITKWLIERVKDVDIEEPITTSQAPQERETFRNWAKLNGARDAIFKDQGITLKLKELGVETGDTVRIGTQRAYRYTWAIIRQRLMDVTKLGEAIFED